MEKGKGFYRQTSRSSPVKMVLLSPPCRLCICTGFLFFCGVMFGMYMSNNFTSTSDGMFGRLTRECDKGRPGLSIKKDLSIQFRDYIPRHIFIDISTGPPHSLDLFMETYPEAQRYTLYAFVADKTYAPLYAKFPGITIFAGVVPSTSNSTTQMKSSPAEQSQSLIIDKYLSATTVDFAAWLKDTIHPDEYVIVKLTTDPKNEEKIARYLVVTGAVEWIDKYYTTSTDYDTIEISKERFSVHNLEVLSWDDDKFTYSDFNDVNPPTTQREDGIRVSFCPTGNSSEFSFALILYASEVNKFSWAALTLLSQLSVERSTKLPVTVLFPLQFLQLPTLCDRLFTLNGEMAIGLYIQYSSFYIPKADDEAQENHIRNKLVSAEHCFARGNSTAEYALSSWELTRSIAGKADYPQKMHKADESDKTQEMTNDPHALHKLLKQAISDRMYTILTDVIDITPKLGVSIASIPDDIHGALTVFDISQEGSDATLLHLLESHLSRLIPLRTCVKYITELRQ